MKKYQDTPLLKDIDKAQIEKWKKEHGKVFAIDVEDKRGIFKQPDRKVVTAAAKFMETGSSIKFVETIMANTFLGGDRELFEVDSYFYGCATKVEELVEIKEAELKEL